MLARTDVGAHNGLAGFVALRLLLLPQRLARLVGLEIGKCDTCSTSPQDAAVVHRRY
jgi:hypothetical protein